MTGRFFEASILNSPYEYPARHWELDETGQPRQAVGIRFGLLGHSAFQVIGKGVK